MFKNYFTQVVENAFLNSQKYIKKNVRKYIKDAAFSNIKVLDIGCGTGEKTKNFFSFPEIIETHGIDIHKKDYVKTKSLIYTQVNLETEKIPYGKNTFDIIISNQVIEHLLDKDTMLEEANRVLKKDGLFILATENISSIDNIISLILGQEPVTQITSRKYRTNSFLSTTFMQKEKHGNKFEHKNVNSYYGLKRILKVNGFINIKMKSFGNICPLVEKIIPIYNRILVASASK